VNDACLCRDDDSASRTAHARSTRRIFAAGPSGHPRIADIDHPVVGAGTSSACMQATTTVAQCRPFTVGPQPQQHMKKYLITSALPYANGYLHLGHIAGAYLPADIYARFLRLHGERVLYVCGSDEHGVAITIAAEKKGVAPQEIIDHYHAANSEAFSGLHWSFDMYGRTSSAEHRAVSQEWFTTFFERGLLREREEDQFFDEEAAMFLPDRYVEGICPNCGSDKARGDQCDACGAYYNQLELKQPKSLVSGKTPVVRKTTHWYYPLGEFQQMLEAYIEGHAGDWKDNVLQQSRSWLKAGLGDRAITRDLSWGVPVPLQNAHGKVLYVWFDAVLGYISATRTWAADRGTPEVWKDWWWKSEKSEATEETEYVAFIGKDNIVFHTLMFPSMLHAHGDYILPAQVPANEFLNLQGQKFSKSRNWSIDVRDALLAIPTPSGRDALRYTLAMNFPETRDSDFTWPDYRIRTNNELAAIFGNFVHRSMQFLHAQFGGIVPDLAPAYATLPDVWERTVHECIARSAGASALSDEDIDGLVEKASGVLTRDDVVFICSMCTGMRNVARLYSVFRFRDAITETMNIARAANKYFNDMQPWKTVKSDRDQCAKTLYICVQSIYTLSVAFAPVMPAVASQIQEMLCCTTIADGRVGTAERGPDVWSSCVLPTLAQGTKLNEPHVLFPKIEEEFIIAMQAQLGAPDSTAPGTATPPVELPEGLITIDDFKKVQLRTARILEAERVPKSDKLIRLIVDTGADQRQILAGIGKVYEPEHLVGLTVVVVVNLKPAKLMGLESQGMLLAANSDSGLTLVTPMSFAPAGAEVR
jgi:methionyl-tRNA synthetase